jgi:hypothetical protein
LFAFRIVGWNTFDIGGNFVTISDSSRQNHAPEAQFVLGVRDGETVFLRHILFDAEMIVLCHQHE